MTETPEKKTIRDTDGQAIRLAKTLIGTARHGALGVVGHADAPPHISRIQLSTDVDGALVTLTSSLSPHTQAMIEKGQASLLVGDPGKGDPLAHPRISLFVQAEKIAHGTADHSRLRRRHLSRHPKAALYADFGDFSFFRLAIKGASLNGGFGRAYNLNEADLKMSGDIDGMRQMEESAVAHMNEDHSDAIALYAAVLGGAKAGKWHLATMDTEGMDLVLGDQCCRIFYDEPLASAGDLRKVLKQLADAARAKQLAQNV
ncbi:MAG: DUF2470 domain-containing protein [Ahrensia sp.]|nr:DUF2470 domain-containing protein [Ahrensia sp.]